MGKKLTYQEIQEYINGEQGNGCVLITTEEEFDEEKGIKADLKIQCNCENKYINNFYNFKYNKKRQCDKCSNNSRASLKRLKYEDVKTYIEIESNSDCKLLSQTYKNNREDIKILCSCGNEFETSFDAFKRGKIRCNECSMKDKILTMTKTHTQFISELFELVGNEYNILDNYINAYTPIRFKHSLCDHIYETTPHLFLSSECRCPKCNGGIAKTHEQFCEEIKELLGNEYTVLSSYINANKKILIRHNCSDCNNYEYWVTPNKILHGRRCPICNQSYGARRILEWLRNNNITFYTEHRFKECKSKRQLPYDFYLPDFNICIEYDGELHYKATSMGNDLEKQKIHDKIKDNYCINNNIKLIRIPYWEFDNIENILERELNLNIIK